MLYFGYLAIISTSTPRYLTPPPPKTIEISMDSKFYIFNISRYHSVLKNLKIVFRNSETSIPLT